MHYGSSRPVHAVDTTNSVIFGYLGILAALIAGTEMENAAQKCCFFTSLLFIERSSIALQLKTLMCSDALALICMQPTILSHERLSIA